MRGHASLDLVAQVDLGVFARGEDGVLDGPRVGSAVADDDHAVDADEGCAPGLGVVRAMLEPAQCRPHQPGAKLLDETSAHDFFLDRLADPLDQPLATLEQDVAGEAVGNHHVGGSLKNVPTLYVTEKFEFGVGAGGGRSAEELERLAREHRPFLFLGPVRQNAYAWAWFLVLQPRVGGTEHRELGQDRGP